MPPQSPGAGLLVAPSPFVSPPALSSLRLVNTTGSAAVPAATNDPLTVSAAPLPPLQPKALVFALTTVPVSAVTVTPLAIASVQLAPQALLASSQGAGC